METKLIDWDKKAREYDVTPEQLILFCKERGIIDEQGQLTIKGRQIGFINIVEQN